MKLLLSDAEQRIITDLFEDIHHSRSLEDFLVNYIGKITCLLGTEYWAVMMLSSEPCQHNIVINNNPGYFNKAYADELVFKDQFLEHLMASDDNHHFLSRFSDTNPTVKEFIGDCNSLRPTGDCYYGTLRFRGRILGMTGFTLLRKRPDFEERQWQILSLVRPALDSGILSHMMHDKIALLANLVHSGEDLSYFFIYAGDLSVEIPQESNSSRIEQILQLRSGDPAGRNLILSRMVERLRVLPVFHTSISETLYSGGGPYTLRLFRRREDRGQRTFNPIILATLERDKEPYAFDSFAQIHSLTRRKMKYSGRLSKAAVTSRFPKTCLFPRLL